MAETYHYFRNVPEECGETGIFVHPIPQYPGLDFHVEKEHIRSGFSFHEAETKEGFIYMYINSSLADALVHHIRDLLQIKSVGGMLYMLETGGLKDAYAETNWTFEFICFRKKDIHKVLRIIDDNLFARYGHLMTEKEMKECEEMTKRADMPHRLAGHVCLEFE